MTINTSFVAPSSTGENNRRIEEPFALSSSNNNLSTILTSAAGAGARRATAIAQLYFRLANYPPLTIVVVDALCVVFGADGASLFQLVDYLGVPEDAIRIALQSIPSEVCCTSDDCVEDGRNSVLFSMGNADERAAFSCNSPRSTVHQERTMKDVDKEENLSASSSVGEKDEELHDGDLRGVCKTTEEVTAKKEKEEMCYYLNYKRLLPFAYAHVCRLLLPLCVLPFSLSHFHSSSLTGGGIAEGHRLTHHVEDDVKQTDEIHVNAEGRLHSNTSFSSEMTRKGREGKQASRPSSPRVAGEWNASTLLLSSALQQRLPDVHEAIKCCRCNMWVDANECVPLSTFRNERIGGASSGNVSAGIGSSSRRSDGWNNDSMSWGTNQTVSSTRVSLTPCPICGEDIVQSTLLAISAHFQESLASGVPLLVVPPSSSSPVGDLERTKPTKTPPTRPASVPSTFVTRSLPSSLQCPLAKDPLLVQQVLIFFELFRIPFACLADDDAHVVDASEILTEPEMLRRLNNRSTVRGEGEGESRNRWGGGSSSVSVAEQFRAVHRQSQSVRVRLVSSPSVEQRKIRENVRKLLKRSSLPPWMRRDSGSAALSASYHIFTTPVASAKHLSSSRPSRRSTSTTMTPTADQSLREKVRQISASENECSAFDAAVFAEEEFEPVEWLSPRYQLHQK